MIGEPDGLRPKLAGESSLDQEEALEY